MDIRYDDIYERCRTISEYEGGRIRDARGELMFPDVRIVASDKALIREFTREAVLLVGKRLSFAVVEVSACDGSGGNGSAGFTIEFVKDAQLKAGGDAEMEQSVESVVVAYVMQHWLMDKSEARGKVWGQIYDEMMSTLPKGINRKRPTLG